MRDAAREASTFVQTHPRSELDTNRWFGLVKWLEIVGEAASRVSSDVQRQHPEVPRGAVAPVAGTTSGLGCGGAPGAIRWVVRSRPGAHPQFGELGRRGDTLLVDLEEGVLDHPSR